MAVTSSITQAISFNESGGSGIATSNRVTSVAPQVTMTTSATGVDMIYSTSFDITGAGLIDIDLYDTNAGGGDADDRGSIRFSYIHGIIVNLESGECAVGSQTPADPWTSAPAYYLYGPSSVSVLSAAAFGVVTSTDRRLRIEVAGGFSAAGSVTFIGEGTII